MFNQDPSLRALRDRIKREDVPMNRFEADVRRLKAPRHGDQETTSTGSIYRAELIYSSDLDTVLSLLKRQAKQDKIIEKDLYEFYFACLDRIDILITERDQLATHQQLMNILQTLS